MTNLTATGPAPRTAGRLLGPRVRTIVVIVVTAIAIAAVTVLIDRPSASGLTALDIEVGPGAPPAVGQKPPDFEALTIDGDAFRLTDFAGQPVWLTFGASWCGDCRAEAPDLQATYDRYRAAGLVVVGVFIEEEAPAVREYADRIGFTFTMTADPEARLAAAYHTLGIPTHYFIGRDGLIREVRLGGLDLDEMDRLVAGVMG